MVVTATAPVQLADTASPSHLHALKMARAPATSQHCKGAATRTLHGAPADTTVFPACQVFCGFRLTSAHSYRHLISAERAKLVDSGPEFIGRKNARLIRCRAVARSRTICLSGPFQVRGSVFHTQSANAFSLLMILPRSSRRTVPAGPRSTAFALSASAAAAGARI